MTAWYGQHEAGAEREGGDAAIARGLSTVEAGAQGEHKLARGYRPVLMHSAHDIADPALRAAVETAAAGNLKPVMAGLPRSDPAGLARLLQGATQVKTIWVPYGA